MSAQEFKIDQEVVRISGGYVIGRVGNIIAIDEEKKRAQVAWHGDNKTWVSFTVIAPTSIPYKIIPSSFDRVKYRRIDAKYIQI